jgi:tripartite-type tricarboxylate transporter receptor subunit TctC
MISEAFKRKGRLLGGLSAAVLAVSLLVPSGAWAQRSEAELAKLFESKPVTVIVGSAPGGGYDVFSRLVARYVGQYLPGNPSFIVRNVPGAGQLRGLRRSMKAKPDGLTLGLLHPRFVQRELAGRDVPDFDLKTVRVLGSPSSGEVPRIWCVRRSIGTSYEGLVKRGKPVTSGGNAPGAAFGIGPQFVMEMGGPIKMVYGYGGTSEIMASFDRGETDGTDRCSRSTALRLYPEWIEQGRLVPIYYQTKPFNDDWLAELGHSGPLPSFRELPGLVFDPAQAEALELNLLTDEISRVFIMPEGIPDDVAQYWQSVFDQLVVDPQFIELLTIAQYDDAYGYGTADDIRGILNRLRNASEETRALSLELSGVGELSVN